MRSRLLTFAAIALVVSACGSAAAPTNSPASSPSLTPSSSPVATVTPGATATATATATPSATPTAHASLAPADALKQLTIVCKTDASNDKSTDTTGVECEGIFKAALPALGSRAGDVVRMEAGLVCPTTGTSCKDRLIVGFADGHLEGAQTKSAGADEPATIGSFHAVAATLWPWGDAASFSSPAPTVPTLPIAASPELAALPALPYCGFEDNTATSAARTCFANAVSTGHAAELVTKTKDPGGDSRVSVMRFTGSGPIAEYDGGISSKGKGTWYSGTTAVMIKIGRHDFIQIMPIDDLFPA